MLSTVAGSLAGPSTHRRNLQLTIPTIRARLSAAEDNTMRLLTMTVSLFLAACAQATPGRPASMPSGPSPAATESPRFEGAPGTPIAARWILKSEANGQTVLVAHIEANAALAVPVQVTIRVPADAQILSGPEQFVIPASRQPYVVEQEIVVSSNGHPMGDLVLEAHAAGPTFGFHAKDAHTFGRERTAVSKPA